MAEKSFSYADVSAHSTTKDLYMVIHDNVYNGSSFIDEHPYVFQPFNRLEFEIGSIADWRFLLPCPSAIWRLGEFGLYLS
jgi:hypothetical protein